MKKLVLLLWILIFVGFFLGILFKGNNFVKERASILCLSCMGLEE